MSLFGEEPPRKSQSDSLFDDEPQSKPATTSNSVSLFSDNTGPDDESFTPSKRKPRGSVVKTLLPSDGVPEDYIDAFDNLLQSQPSSGGRLSFASIERLLDSSALGVAQKAKVLESALPQRRQQEDGQGVERSEFNVLLALIGLAQEEEEISLDAVDERRLKLPVPSFSSLKASAVSQAPDPGKQEKGSDSTTATPRTPVHDQPSLSDRQQRLPSRNSALNDPMSDPWASPNNSTRKNLNRPSSSENPLNGGPHPATRTTSNFTTVEASSGMQTSTDKPSVSPADGGAEAWTGGFASGSFASEGGFGQPLGESESDESREQPFKKSAVRSTVGPRPRSRPNDGAQEVLNVTALPDKEGMFLFQYRNYEISSSRRATKVIRRYSDFVWLLDCLHKRYPFRQLPLLPPKRVSINGNHIAADSLFIDKRRRGLTRFANALIRHAVLREEQLVNMFLTVPTELSTWRKSANLTLNEEFHGQPLPPNLEDSLPSEPQLQELFATVRSGVRRSAETYIQLCALLERLTKRKEGLASDYSRLSSSLQSLTDCSGDTYALDGSDVPILNDGITATAKHLNIHHELVEEEARRSWDEQLLEDFKTQRDCLVSMRDMFDRHERYARDNIPTLEKRITSNEGKLAGVRGKPDDRKKPGEAEKLKESIMRDKEAIVAQHARNVLIKECMRDEIKAFVGTNIGVWARSLVGLGEERSRWSEAVGQNWNGLREELEGLLEGLAGSGGDR